MADAIKSNIQSLPIVRGYGTEEKTAPGRRDIRPETGAYQWLRHLLHAGGQRILQREDRLRRLQQHKNKGLSARGNPTKLVARGVESGTSWKQKYPFVRPAVNKSRKATEKRMEEILDREIEKLMK